MTASILLGNKCTADTISSNHLYARVAEITSLELYLLEFEILLLLDYKLHVTSEEYDLIIKNLQLYKVNHKDFSISIMLDRTKTDPRKYYIELQPIYAISKSSDVNSV